MTPPDAPLILVINPGSTTCRYALFRGLECLVENELAAEADLEGVVQGGRRFLGDQGLSVGELDAVVARGGILRALPGGTYAVNDAMVQDCVGHRHGRHASNLGAPAARRLADEAGVPALIANPPTVDELCDEARVTGLPEISRRSVFHALNQKAIAADLAARLGIRYASARLIVIHAGGGVSVAAHRDGLVVDVNDALGGDGPFGFNRAGGLPGLPLLRWAEGKPAEDVARAICSAGGVFAHLGTDDAREVERRIGGGDCRAAAVFEAFAYHVARAAAALAVPLDGKVDAIALTGGLARWPRLVDRLSERLGWLAPVHVFPGSREMGALAAAAVSVLQGKDVAKEY